MTHNFKGIWIGADMTVEERFAPIFKKEFTLDKKAENAKIYISGLGLFELKINGQLPDGGSLFCAMVAPTQIKKLL